MCLVRIDERLEPTNKVRKAWGVFMVHRDGAVTSGYLRAPITPGVWMKAEEKVVSAVFGRHRYLSGFHKYALKKIALRSWIYRREHPGFVRVILPVQLRRVHTIGSELDGRVLVASEMRVLKRHTAEAIKKAMAALKRRAGRSANRPPCGKS